MQITGEKLTVNQVFLCVNSIHIPFANPELINNIYPGKWGQEWGN